LTPAVVEGKIKVENVNLPDSFNKLKPSIPAVIRFSYFIIFIKAIITATHVVMIAPSFTVRRSSSPFRSLLVAREFSIVSLEVSI
jgi:hypothetical protein